MTARDPGADHPAYFVNRRTGGRTYSRLARLRGKAGRPVGRPAAAGILTRRAAIAAGIAAVSVVSDFPDWAPHVAHADQIAATGVPLLSLSALAGKLVSQPVPPSSGIVLGPMDWGQPGYDMLFTLQCPLGTATPYGQVQMTWFDKASGQVVSEDTWIMPAAQNPGVWAMFGRGPSRGNQLIAKLSNLDSSAAMTGSVYAVQHSRPYIADDWQYDSLSNASNTVPGITTATFPEDSSVLGMLGGVTIPAGTTSAFLFGMHAGLIGVGLDQGAGAWTNIGLMIAPQPNSSYVIDNPVYAAMSPPPAFQVCGPRAPLRVQLHNTATTAFTATMSLIRAS